MPKPTPCSAAEANRRKVKCPKGHTGHWRKHHNNVKHKRCSQCDRDRAREFIYGLSSEAFDQLKQRFPVCAICKGTGEGVGRGVLEIDHNHKTGEVRGLLCRVCNLALGWYESHRDKISAFEDYLREN